MEIDLRKNGRLSIENAREITRLEPIVRLEYNKFIGDLAESNKLEGIEWLTRVVCRNTYISMIHDRMCRLALLESLLQDNKPLKSIKVDDPAMGKAVTRVLAKYNKKASVEIQGASRINRFQLAQNLIKTVYFSLILWLLPKLSYGRNKPNEPIIYLDSFLHPNSFDSEKRLKDRYYPGLIDSQPLEDQKKFWYIPTLNGFRYPHEILKVLRQVASSKTSILLKEDYLRAIDYLKAIFLSVVLPNKLRQIPKWRSINISEIVKEEISLDRGSLALVSAILIFLSFKRFRENGIKILKVIDWFENQNVDRALNLGVKTYYPEVTTKGCLGFVVSGYYAGLSPTHYEFLGKTLPDSIDVVGGETYTKERSKFCKEIPFSSAPAFRFQETIKFKQLPNAEKNVVLLALPILIDESKEIIQLALNTKFDENFKWIIKHHPSYSRDQFTSLIPESKDDFFEFSDKSMADLFQNTRLLVTAASSTCLEAVVCGIPVAILGSRSGPTLNPLKGIIDDSFWSVCFTSENLKDALIRNPPNQHLNISHYLKDVTPETVSQFLEYDDARK